MPVRFRPAAAPKADRCRNDESQEHRNCCANRLAKRYPQYHPGAVLEIAPEETFTKEKPDESKRHVGHMREQFVNRIWNQVEDRWAANDAEQNHQCDPGHVDALAKFVGHES